jgi:hypothetical protein
MNVIVHHFSLSFSFLVSIPGSNGEWQRMAATGIGWQLAYFTRVIGIWHHQEPSEL